MRVGRLVQWRVVVAVAMVAAVVAGCGSGPETGGEETSDGPPTAVLTGTRWQLVEIQSMSDEVDTARPDDPTLYTLSFHPDSSVALRLNCNRGTGSWSVQPSSDTGGSLRFGPIAMTRALCPPPSLDERIAADLSFVRSYTLADGRLHLSLMADGGIYTWEPMAPSE